jgi:plastocyanin
LPLLALSSGHKLGLGLVAALFIGFAVLSALVIPRYRPQYPGGRGLRAFVALTCLIFVGMLFAVEFFGRESEEAAGKEGTSPATTNAGTPVSVPVTETEYKIQLKSRTFNKGRHAFAVKNAGVDPHNLTIKGPGLSKAATPNIAAGHSAKLTAALEKGTYELYCSLPGHKQLGMDVKITVR